MQSVDVEAAELGHDVGVARAEAEAPRGRSGPRRAASVAWIGLRFALALFLFVGALQLMKTGAASLDVLKPGGFLVANAASTLGLGWLGALLVLSGSPIAASALTLVAAGEEAAAGVDHFTEIQGFTMLTGSRLGAAFVVLVTAVVYALRGGAGHRKAPVSTAVIALCTTALIYVPAAFIGLALLSWGPFHALELQFPSRFIDLIDLVYGPFVERAKDLHPGLVFLGGLAVLLVSFKLIDTVLPTLDETRMGPERLSWLRRKWPMFGLGSLVALVTMSVSIALTVLIPLVAKKYVSRDYIIPYIMGANITTLGDTMLAAFALGSPAAVRIVLAEVIVDEPPERHPAHLLLSAAPLRHVALPQSLRQEPAAPGSLHSGALPRPPHDHRDRRGDRLASRRERCGVANGLRVAPRRARRRRAERDRHRCEPRSQVAPRPRGGERNPQGLVKGTGEAESRVAQPPLVEARIDDARLGPERRLTAPGRGAAKFVLRDRGGLVPQRVAVPAEPSAEVGVLAVEEEALVEAAYLLECRTTHEQDGSDERLRLRSALVPLPHPFGAPLRTGEQMVEEQRLAERGA